MRSSLGGPAKLPRRRRAGPPRLFTARRIPASPLIPALSLLLGVVIPGAGSRLLAQSPVLSRFSLEPRVGVAFPTGDFGDVDPTCPSGSSGCPFPVQVGTETGWRWSLRALFALNPRLSLVGEYGKAKLGCSPSFCGTEERPETQGATLGIRLIAFGLGSMDFWVEGSGVLERPTIVRTRSETGETAISSVSYPWSPGFSVGVGTELDLKGDGTLFFSPGFRFRYIPADPPESDPDLASITATYLLIEVGFRVVLTAG